MAKGDHIFVHRVGYTHQGIDVGDETVIHYTGEPGQKVDATIRQTSLDRFARGCTVHVRPYAVCDPPVVTIERAMSRLGENKYISSSTIANTSLPGARRVSVRANR